MPSDTELLDWMAANRVTLDAFGAMEQPFNLSPEQKKPWRLVVYSPLPTISSLSYIGKTPREAITEAVAGLADTMAKLGGTK